MNTTNNCINRVSYHGSNVPVQLMHGLHPRQVNTSLVMHTVAFRKQEVLV